MRLRSLVRRLLVPLWPDRPPRVSQAGETRHIVIGEGEAALPVALHLPRPGPGSEPRTAAPGTALVIHGRNGTALTPHLVPVIDALLAAGHIVCVPELRHSDANDAPGTLATFRMETHVEDARRALDWLLDRAALPEGVAPAPVLVAGHSMGGYAALRLAAERGPAVVGGVLAIAPVVSGAALLAARRAMGPGAIRALATETPGAVEDYAGHDIETVARHVVQPVGVIVGAKDGLTRPMDVRMLDDVLASVLAHTVLADEDHCPKGPAYRTELDRQIALLAGTGERRLRDPSAA